MFYKSDLGIWKSLITIYEGLKREYDYVLVVSGDTGSGKSKWALHLMEAWQRIIGKEISEDLIKQNNVDKKLWLESFKKLEDFDINVFDEGAKGLSSKQWNEKFSKLLEQLFQVIRFKRFFTVIIVPNFFRLDKFFREDRLRGLVYIDKRGNYKYYTRKRVIELTSKNERLQVKNMNLVTPIHSHSYPDYKGVMLKKYNEMKEEGVNNILEETIQQIDEDTISKAKNISNFITPDVLELKASGMSYREIAKELSDKHDVEIGFTRVRNIVEKAVISKL